jgi:hypothetical protein
MQILAAWVPAGYRLGVILHWRLPAPHELAREVDRSFMQLPTRPFCSSSVCRTNETSMRHASACTMHGRRGGALVRLVPQRAATLGGGTPSGRPLPASFPVPTFPRGLSRRGRSVALSERSAGRHLDSRGWPERALEPLSPTAGWRRLPSSWSS